VLSLAPISTLEHTYGRIAMGLSHRQEKKSLTSLSESLRRFMPLNRLDPERRNELARHAKVVNVQASRKLFSSGDTGKHLIYLLDGEVELRSARDTFIVESDTKQGTMPLDVYIPHRYTAITMTPVTLIYIERNLLDVLLVRDTVAEYNVQDITESSSEGDDWMSVILRSSLFHKIPPVNIQRMLASLETNKVKTGDILFKQGDNGDNFYFIQSGQVEVIRSTRGQEQLVVAQLGPGDSFGEEALLSNHTRNATIRCISDTILLCLSRVDFDELLKTPVIQQISFMHAQSLYQNGAVWLDVRQPDEQKTKIKNAVSIPLGKLRASIPQLDPNATYIAICNNGQRSACAAYLLSAYGINAVVLKNGLNN
jgi:CRP-like cAMP-binding protein